MPKATKEQFEAMHRKLAEVLTGMISPDMNASLVKEIREFLKDNGIDAIATEGSPLLKLAGKLPFNSAAEA